jgi:hypothetical protein
VDFHRTLTINGILFQNRLDDPDAKTTCPKHVLFEASADGRNWKAILDVKELLQTRREQQLPCSTVMSARYLKFRVLSNWTDDPYTFIGEIGIY